MEPYREKNPNLLNGELVFKVCYTELEQDSSSLENWDKHPRDLREQPQVFIFIMNSTLIFTRFQLGFDHIITLGSFLLVCSCYQFRKQEESRLRGGILQLEFCSSLDVFAHSAQSAIPSQ